MVDPPAIQIPAVDPPAVEIPVVEPPLFDPPAVEIPFVVPPSSVPPNPSPDYVLGAIDAHLTRMFVDSQFRKSHKADIYSLIGTSTKTQKAFR